MNTLSRSRTLWIAGMTAVLAGTAGTASASGFALIEQSASGLGNAFAGGAASAEDASTIFFNPAGLTRLTGTQLVFGGHAIRPSVEFQDQGSTDVTGAPLRGGEGGDAGDLALVPILYIAHALNERMRIGLGINAPFGLVTEYDAEWKGRYQGVTSDLETININPAFAFKINEALSLGAGVNLQYIEAKLSNAVDFGTICFGSTLGPAGCTTAGLTPQNADGFARIEGDDWSWGFNAGLLLQLDENTRFGLAYRSHIEHTLEGTADFSNVPGPLTMGGAVFVDTGASAGITLPENVSLSAFRQIDSRWAVMGDVTWTRWSRFKELRIDFDSAQPDSVTVEDWQDVMRYSIGVNYSYSPTWTLHAGLAYDEAPVRNASLRTPRIPDGERYWLAFGFGYRLNKDVRFDIAYTHLFVPDQDINHVGATGDTLKGEYESAVDILGIQMAWQLK